MMKMKYGIRMAGLFMAMVGMLSLWGCADYYDYDSDGSVSKEPVSELDTEDAEDAEDGEGNPEEQETVFSIKIKADDKPIRLEEKLEGKDEIEKITIVVDAKAAEEKVLDYEYLENLEYLNSLAVHDGQLSDISFVSELEQLNLLDLKECAISDVEPLKELERLIYLDLSGNEIQDISPLANMNLVKELNLADNPIEDPAQLGELAIRLEALNLDNTGISDITFLARTKYLKKLSLKNNQIREFEALRGSEHLTELDISGNPIEDPSIFLYIPNTTLFVPADCEKEPWKSEIDKAFLRFNPLDLQTGTEDVRVNNCAIGDFNGDGMDDLGVIVWWWDYYDDINERRFYLYLGNENGYDEPLQPLALGEYSGYMSEESLVINKGRVYLCKKQPDGSEVDITIRVISYHDGAWECEIYSNSKLYACYPGEDEDDTSRPERTDLIVFETANFITNEYQEYLYIDEDVYTGFFEKYPLKKNKLSICVYQENTEGESSLPVIADYYPSLPDFSQKTAGFRLAEKTEEEWESSGGEPGEYGKETEPFGGVLERILEEYYPGCRAQKIFYDIECLENMERLQDGMLPEYFYGIETEEGMVYLLLTEKFYRYTCTAYLNGEVYEEYVYNTVSGELMKMDEYENSEYAW